MIVGWAWRYLWFLKMWLKQKLGTEYRMFWNSDFKLLSLFCFWIFALLFFVNLQEYESITPSQESIEEGNPVLNIDCWKESQVLTFNQESGDGIALDKVSIYDITPYIKFLRCFYRVCTFTCRNYFSLEMGNEPFIIHMFIYKLNYAIESVLDWIDVLCLVNHYWIPRDYR